MKKLKCILVIAVLLLCACGSEADWQEQYDLGMQYLSDGNYNEAIVAFTAAIEIDPNRADAYIGRADAYIGNGEMEENLTAALADYLKAMELDEQKKEAYLGAADVYILQNKHEQAQEILMSGEEKAGNDQRFTDYMERYINEEIVEQPQEESEISIYQVYADKLYELQGLYGKSDLVTAPIENIPSVHEENMYLTGLCFAQLIDFDADGTEELMVAYRDPAQNTDGAYEQNYVVEVWGYKERRIEKLYTGEPLGSAEEGRGISIVLHNGKYYIYTMENSEGIYDPRSNMNINEYTLAWLGLTANGFETEQTIGTREYIPDTTYSLSDIVFENVVNSTVVSREEYEAARMEWGSGYGTEGGFSWGLQNCGDMLQDSLSMLAETFDILNANLY